jgi:hypothetical protein
MIVIGKPDRAYPANLRIGPDGTKRIRTSPYFNGE